MLIESATRQRTTHKKKPQCLTQPHSDVFTLDTKPRGDSAYFGPLFLDQIAAFPMHHARAILPTPPLLH
jgi:hypothetical protein